MKKIIFKMLIFCFMMLVNQELLHGQCFADAGENVALCSSGYDTFHLGGAPTAFGGVPPYTYKWTCNCSNEWFHYTASDFLNDSTSSNPNLTSWIEPSLTFNLEVTDAVGATCTDSILIRFSSYIISTDVKHAHLHPGDSTNLYTSVYGGIPPYTYLWTPPIGLTDPFDVYTVAKPDSSIIYELIVTDSAGCAQWDNFYVFVITTSVNETTAESFDVSVIPNPVTDISTIVMAEDKILSPSGVIVYDMNGRIRKKIVNAAGSIQINRSDFESGIYIFRIEDQSGRVGYGKFAVQ